jgi:hypothetical protein
MSVSTRRAALGAILAAPLASVPAVAAPPSDLARACDWAIAHVNWINTNDEPLEAWPDGRVDGELARVDAVLDRIADEPAGDRADFRAKARLLLMEWGACLDGHKLHPHERALMTFLREAASCA